MGRCPSSIFCSRGTPHPFKFSPLRSEVTRLNPSLTEGLEVNFAQISSFLSNR